LLDLLAVVPTQSLLAGLVEKAPSYTPCTASQSLRVHAGYVRAVCGGGVGV
jgi:hypothetical protein